MDYSKRKPGPTCLRFKKQYGLAIDNVIRPIVDRLCEQGISRAAYSDQLAGLIDRTASVATEQYSQVLLSIPYEYGDTTFSRDDVILGVEHIIDAAIRRRRRGYTIERSLVYSSWIPIWPASRWRLDLQTTLTRIS